MDWRQIFMFVINNTAGQSVIMNEIYEEGFNLTADSYLTQNISRIKPDIFGDYLKKIESNNGKDCSGEIIPTGIDTLDAILGGGFGTGLHVIGANPGMGKTSLMLHILINLALKKRYSLFFSLDMSSNQTTMRLAANTSYRFSDLENKTINDISNAKVIMKDKKVDCSVQELYDRYSTAIDPYINILSVHGDSLGKIDKSVTYIESVETAIKNFKQYSKARPVVVIDFLQLLRNKPSSTYRDENDGEITLKSYDKRLEMDHIIDALKDLSTVYDVPIIVITSINRSSYTKSNGYSNDDYDISFSKESGNIEYMADVLIRLTSGDGATIFGGPNMERVNLMVVKSRSGKQHVTIPLDFIPEYAYFQSVEENS